MADIADRCRAFIDFSNIRFHLIILLHNSINVLETCRIIMSWSHSKIKHWCKLPWNHKSITIEHLYQLWTHFHASTSFLDVQPAMHCWTGYSIEGESNCIKLLRGYDHSEVVACCRLAEGWHGRCVEIMLRCRLTEYDKG